MECNFRPSLAVRVAVCVTVVAVAFVQAGCGSARKSEIPESRSRADTQLRSGRLVFMHNCNQCHVRGGAGLGPALNNKPLPAFAIKSQVRDGHGAMPPFSKADIGDEQLDALVKYLEERRHEAPLASR